MTLIFDFSATILFSVLYGFGEWELLRHAKTTGDKVIFGQFSKYHLFMLAIFITVSLPLINLWIVPIMLLIEDISYRFAKGVWVQPGNWVTWKFGGVHLAGIYFPGTYFILIAVSYGLYELIEWIK